MKIGNFNVDNDQPLVLIAGPCQIETLDHARMIADRLCGITSRLGVSFVYKSSYDKANRSSIDSHRGVGLVDGLSILDKIKQEFNIPVLTDVHNVTDVADVAEIVDVIQIPAFLCRQTDLLEEAAIQAIKFNRVVNVKKGQFLAPHDMQHVVDKFTHFNFENIMLTERGVSFGYNQLVSDMTSLPIMKNMDRPVIFDATHSVQRPGGLGKTSGGSRVHVQHLARAAASIGIAGVFMETHQDPDNAPSDGPNMIYLNDMETILGQLMAIDNLIKGW